LSKPKNADSNGHIQPQQRPLCDLEGGREEEEEEEEEEAMG